MISVIFYIFVSFIAVVLIRNQAVYSERTEMSNLIFAQADWEKYLSLKRAISYDEMMVRFWIWPIHRMWPQELKELREKARGRTNA